MKKLLVISLSFLIAVSLSSCTSSDGNKDNASNAASSDENMPLDNGGDFNKDASVDGAPAADGSTPPADGSAAPPGDAQASAGLDDVPLDGNVDASKSAATPPADGAGSLDLGDPEGEFPADVAKSQKDGVAPTDDKLFADAGAPAPSTAPTDPSMAPPDVTATPQDASASTTEPPIDGSAATNDVGAAAGASSSEASNSAPPIVLPYEKIKTEPFEKKGAMLNRVYLARDKDTAKGISEKIYGTAEHVKDLKAWNPSLKNHAPRVGDKIYYTSPKDPQDNTKMLVFYEEMGVAPQTYVTQPGDDIRKVSTKLLGHKDSWKEIYATNAALENKMGKAPEGVELRYWPAMNDAAPTLASGQAPPTGGLPQDQMNNTDPNAPAAAGTMVGQAPPAPGAPGTMPPPAPSVAAAPPPPPPMEQPVAQAPPPPPPMDKPLKKPASPAQNLEAGADPDQTMMMLAGGLLIVAAAAAFVVIRRQRAKRIDLSQQTQV